MDYLTVIGQEVQDVLSKINRDDVGQAAKLITKDTRVFIDGEGRSGLIGKCFAMRLMHLGFTAYVMGESTTPSFKVGDIFLSISGSGKSGSVVLNAEKAKKSKCQLISVLSKIDSSLGNLADVSIQVPATTRADTSERGSIQLLGSLFDQTAHLLLDGVTIILSEREQISNESATKNHV